MTNGLHVPVLLHETIRGLSIAPDAVVLDGTFGRGGHARAILALLGPGGRLVALDRDTAAEIAAQSITDPRFVFRRVRFSNLSEVLEELGIRHVGGIVLDLGISSPQIDEAQRGFSFQREGPLDMRMDTTHGDSAADFVARATVRELTEVLHNYGEERFAQSIAGAIVAARANSPIVRTRELATVVAKAIGKRPRRDWSQDPATRTFQALRIFINRELDELLATLPRALSVLAPGGRLAVISFHSLEDRIVKRFFARASQPYGGDPRLARLPLPTASLPGAPLALVGRAQKPSAAEIRANPRSRSAILRVAERTHHAIPRALLDNAAKDA